MIAVSELAKEYGTALFMLACEADAKQSYARALGEVEEIFSENPDYLTFLSSPSIPLGERMEAICAAFTDRVPEHVLSYLMLMCEKGRISEFPASVKEYRILLDASEHLLQAKVVSAVALTEAESEKLRSKLESIYHGRVAMTYEVDPALLGGLVVEVDGKIMDGSLRHRLREVKEVMNV